MRIVTRAVTEQDRKANRYFDHMGGLEGTVQNVYGVDEVAVKVELAGLSAITADVHKQATIKMRQKFLDNVGEEQKKQLTSEELNFEPHYVLLIRSADLEKAS